MRTPGITRVLDRDTRTNIDICTGCSLSQDLPIAVQDDINGCAKYFCQNSPLLDILGVVIIDEAHLINEISRGPSVENLVGKLRLIQQIQADLGKRQTKIICLSGTLSERDRFANILGRTDNGSAVNGTGVGGSSMGGTAMNDGTSCDVIVVNDRPHDLKFVAIKTWIKSMIDMKDEHVLCCINGLRIDAGVHHSSQPEDGRPVPWYGINGVEQNDLDLVSLLCYQSLKERKGLLIFCPTKAWTVTLCRKLIKAVRGWRIMDKTDCSVLDDMMDDREDSHTLVSRFPDSPDSLKEVVRYRMGYHNSDVSWCERQELERAFSKRDLFVICCTTTLAMGVNLPVHRVCIRSMQRMTWETFHQISGRAGRSRLVHGEVYVCCENECEYKQALRWLETQERNDPAVGVVLPPERSMTDLAKFIMELFAINIAWSMTDLLAALRSNSFYYKEINDDTVRHVIAFLVCLRFLDFSSVAFDWSQGWYQSLRLSPFYLSIFFCQDPNMYRVFQKEVSLFKELWSCTPQECKKLLSRSIRLGKVQSIAENNTAEPTVLGKYLLIMKAALKKEKRTEGKADKRTEGKAEKRTEGKAEKRTEGKAASGDMIYVTPLGNSCVRSAISLELMMDINCLLNRFLRIGIPLNDRACLLGLCVNPELLYYNKLASLDITQIGINSIILDLYDLSELQHDDESGGQRDGQPGGRRGEGDSKRTSDRLKRCIELVANGTVKLPVLKQFYSRVIMDKVTLMEFQYFTYYRNLYRYIGMSILYDLIEYELPMDIVAKKYEVDSSVLTALEHQVHIIASALSTLLNDLNLGSLSIIFSEIQKDTKYFPQEEQDSLTEQDRHAIHELQSLDILKGTRGTHLYLNGFLTIKQISESHTNDLAACINKLLPVNNELIGDVISDTARTIAVHIKSCAIKHMESSTSYSYTHKAVVHHNDDSSSDELSSDDSL